MAVQVFLPRPCPLVNGASLRAALQSISAQLGTQHVGPMPPSSSRGCWLNTSSTKLLTPILWAEAVCPGVPRPGWSHRKRGITDGGLQGAHTTHGRSQDSSLGSSPCSIWGQLATCYTHARESSRMQVREYNVITFPNSIALTYRRRKSSLAAHRKVFITDNTTPPNSPRRLPCYHWGVWCPWSGRTGLPSFLFLGPPNGAHEGASEPPYYRRNTGQLLENPDNWAQGTKFGASCLAWIWRGV